MTESMTTHGAVCRVSLICAEAKYGCHREAGKIGLGAAVRERMRAVWDMGRLACARKAA